jgi:phosphoribosylaminoimidazole carboxylase (NCAIR synthetase)
MLENISPQTKLASIALRVGLVALAVLAIFAAGLVFGGQLEKASWQKKALQAAKVSTEIINVKQGETEQCRAQVAKFTLATTEIEQRRIAELQKDRQAREIAAQEAAIRDKDSRQKAQRVLTALLQIQEGIDSGKFDACTNTIADSNFIGLLNDAITTNRSGYAGRDGPVSDTGAGD